MKSNYVKRAIKFMETFLDYIGDTSVLYSNHFKVVSKINSFNNKYHRKIIFSYGMTRRVLISSDYVIKWDYDKSWIERVGGCQKEYEVYLEAIQDGYDYLFAATTPCQIKGITFYVMPRVNRTSKFEKGQHDDIFEFLTDDEIDWVCDRIEDIHNENWGYLNNHPVIFDYACHF